VKYILNNYHYNVPDKELIDDLRNTAKKNRRKSLAFAEYDKLGKFSSSVLAQRFGSWNRALWAAGLKIIKYSAISEDALFENMKLVWDKLRKQPVQKDMVRPVSAHSATTYIHKFGSWRSALVAFVERMKKRSKFKALADTKQAPALRNKKAVVRKKDITKSMRFDVFRRDHFKCRLCGASPAVNPKVILHVDHIKPQSKGGRTTLKNLQTLCSDCNLGKGAKVIKVKKSKLLRRK